MISNSIGEENFTAAIVDLLSENPCTTINRDQFVQQLNLHSSEDVFPPGEEDWSRTILSYATRVRHTEIVFVHKATVTGYGIGNSLFSYAHLPIDYMTETIPAASGPKLWVYMWNEATIGHEDEPWLVVNPEQYGSYRVAYSANMYEEFTRQFSIDHTPFNRGQLIMGSASDADGGMLNLRHHLFLIQYLVNETDIFAWRAARLSYERFAFRMRGASEMENFYQSYIDLAEDEYLEHRIGNESADFEKTMEVGRVTCYSGYWACVQDAEEYYEETVLESSDGLEGSRDFQKLIYCTLAKFSTTARQEELAENVLQLWMADRGVFAKSRTAMEGLACTLNPEIINRFLEFATTDRLEVEYGVSLTPAERLFMLRTFLYGSYESVVQSLEYILENFSVIAGVIPELMSDLFTGMREFMSTAKVSSLLRDIKNIEAEEMTEELQRMIGEEEAAGYTNQLMSSSIQSQFQNWLVEKGLGDGELRRGSSMEEIL